ncbi:ankyrin repeat domain-containing protein 50-like [Mercenaria mercenaria]|uniref:ankyrin repeat domain-containing protein 50-like n=1 Tax=Mercenaria mercenaria TaxID=6596 RepID=UPI00234F4E75|nr:ankyrin repeat domain-containing protein 50-like [Mercenaria mercenaria]
MASNGRRNARDNSRAGFEKREKRRQIRALQEAIDNHSTESVQKILENEFDVDFQYRSQTALQLSVKEGCYDICKILIDKGANVNMADAEQNNLLNMAAWRGYLEIVELLIENGADIDDQNINGYSAIHTCASRGQTDVLQLLISSNADLDSLNRNSETALHVAVKERNTEIVQLLLLGGCKMDKIDENRKTPLMYAAQYGFDDVVQILINGGASVNLQDKLGRTALFEAVHNGHLNVVQTLAKMGADVNLPVTKGASPLLESINQDHTDIAVFLIDAKCNVNQTDRLHQAPIHSAVAKVSQFFQEESEQAVFLVRKLVESGCDLNVPNQEGERPLYQCACGGSVEMVKYLLSKRVDLNVKTKTGDTILHGGVHSNKPEIVDALIQAGCALNEKNNIGEHALLTAVIYRADLQIVDALIKAGSSLDMRDKASGNTSLHSALLHYNSEAAELLIDAGSDVNALNGKRQTPLYMACEKNEDKVVRKILENKRFSPRLFSISQIPQPLFAAVKNNHVHLVDLLIKAGCDINMINIEGLSPVLMSIKENCSFVTKLLLMYNCDLEAHAKVKRLFKCCLEQEDQHPHFGLEPLFLSLTHRSVEMIKLLVKCYWKQPVTTLKTLYQVFSTTPELSTHYSPELKAEILELFQVSMTTPRGLQESCRAVIRQKLGPCPQLKLDKLPVAKTLHGYLLMDECFKDLFDKIREREISHPKDFHDFHSVGYIPDDLDFGEGSEEEDT